MFPCHPLIPLGKPWRCHRREQGCPGGTSDSPGACHLREARGAVDALSGGREGVHVPAAHCGLAVLQDVPAGLLGDVFSGHGFCLLLSFIHFLFTCFRVPLKCLVLSMFFYCVC